MGRPSNTAERRAEILQAFLGVLAHGGYQGATIAAVARAAELNPGLLHYHFERKLDMLVALVTDLSARVEERAVAKLGRAGDDPQRRLLAYVNAHVALGPGADPQVVAAWVAIGAEAIRQPEVRAVYQQAVAARLARFEGLFRDVLRARGRRQRSAPRMAAAVLAAVEGAYQLSVAAPDALPKGFAAPALKRMIQGLLGEE